MKYFFKIKQKTTTEQAYSNQLKYPLKLNFIKSSPLLFIRFFIFFYFLFTYHLFIFGSEARSHLVLVGDKEDEIFLIFVIHWILSHRWFLIFVIEKIFNMIGYCYLVFKTSYVAFLVFLKFVKYHYDVFFLKNQCYIHNQNLIFWIGNIKFILNVFKLKNLNYLVSETFYDSMRMMVSFS